MRLIITLLVLLKLSTSVALANPDKIVGMWLSEKKDLKVQVFKYNGKYYGKIVWFYCPPTKPSMNKYFDVKNPNTSLRTRPWLGLQSVRGLKYEKNNVWGNGTIYDPKTGKTYSAVAKLENNSKLMVRGFVGVQFLGKNLVFNKVKA